MRLFPRPVTTVLLIVLMTAGGGFGQDETAEILSAWRSALQATEAALLADSWEEGAGLSQKLVADMVGRLKSGDDSAALLALAVAHQALGEAGAGRLEDAVWHFQAAQNLNPAFRSAPLDRFGMAGTALAPHRLRAAGESAGETFHLDEPGLAIRPPELLESPTMVFRGSARVLSEFDRGLRVEIVIDAEGRVLSPVVTGSRLNPTPILVSLEVLRDWRFAPAVLESSPVAVFYEIAVPVTRGAAERARQDLETRLAEFTGAVD